MDELSEPSKMRLEADHLDDIMVMLLADGEPVAPPVAAHAIACQTCSARVDAWRAEATAWRGVFALDEGELAFLLEARVPQQVASLTSGSARAQVVDREGLLPLVAVVAVVATGYAGWLLAQPLVAAAGELARRVGLTSLAAQALTGWAIGLAQTSWNALRMVKGAGLLDAPQVPLLVLALFIWSVLSLLARPSVRAETA